LWCFSFVKCLCSHTQKWLRAASTARSFTRLWMTLQCREEAGLAHSSLP
jgi:hypothetical protein